MRIVLKATNFGNLMGSSPVIPSQYDRPVGDHGDSICNCHNKSAYEGGEQINLLRAVLVMSDRLIVSHRHQFPRVLKNPS